jgi:hypothetical protein
MATADENPDQEQLPSQQESMFPTHTPIGVIRRPQWHPTASGCRACNGELWTNETDPAKLGDRLACIKCGKTSTTGILEKKISKQQFAIARKAQTLRNRKKGNRP